MLSTPTAARVPGTKGYPGGTNYPAPRGLRDENDAWGWDWSPSLDPIAIWKSVRIVATDGVPFLVSFSPKTTVVATDPASKQPTAFLVNTSFEFMVAPNSPARVGTLSLTGDWGKTSTTQIRLPAATAAIAATATVHAVLDARVPAVKLWWPLHYGSPSMHTFTAQVTWHGADQAWAGSPQPPVTKRLGFRSVGLDTGPAASSRPARIDPAHATAFVGCFKDGNPYWGGPQHALPFKAADQPDMTVSHCIQQGWVLQPHNFLFFPRKTTRNAFVVYGHDIHVLVGPPRHPSLCQSDQRKLHSCWPAARPRDEIQPAWWRQRERDELLLWVVNRGDV